MRNALLTTAITATIAALAPSAEATVVTGFAAPTAAAGVWYNADVRPGGTASVVNLTGAGGNLENAQPLPTGAAKLTTDMTNSAKAEVAVNDNYGVAKNILSSLKVNYSFYRDNLAGGNMAAAPSLKLSFLNAGSTDPDHFVSLVYEAYTQTPGLLNPPSNVWTGVDIDFDNGLFWANGGLGLTNTFGGPPYQTLRQWLSTGSDFANASLVTLAMGVGTFNQGQIGYFDDVRISHTFGSGFSAAYDFQAADAAAGTVPEPASLALAGLALIGLFATRRKG